MKKPLFYVIFSLLFAGCFAAKKKKLEKDEGVYILTDKNYFEGVKEFDYLLVYFYAPWCGHCKAFGPEIVKAGQQFLEKDSNIRIAKVHGPDNPELLKKMNVTGYPTLFFYRNADEKTLRTEEMYQPIKYEGGRFAFEMVHWCESKVAFLNHAETLKTAYDVKQAIGNSEVIVIGFFKDMESEKAKDYFKAVRDYDEYRTSFTTDEEAMKNHNAQDGDVIMFKKYDQKRVVFEGAAGYNNLKENQFHGQVTKAKIVEFIQRHSLPLVVEFNHENAQKAFRGWVGSHLLIFASKQNHTWNEIVQKATKLAGKEEFFMKLMFLMVDLDEDDHRRVIDYLHLKNETFPLIRIVQMKSDILRWKPLEGVHDNMFVNRTGLQQGYNVDSFNDKVEAVLNEEQVFKFGKDYLDGNVPRFYYSEKTPTDWNDYPVKLLTGNNFEQIVQDKTKDILISYYAPWCGHCKQLHPEWDKLGEALKDNSTVVIGKMDATLNELSHTIVRSFPTIRLHKKGRKEAFTEYVEYNGERTFEGIKKFLDTDGVYGLAAPDEDGKVAEEVQKKGAEEVQKKKDEL